MNENKDFSLSVFNIRIKKPKEKTSTNNRRTEKDENVIIITESEDKPSYVLNYTSGNRQEAESLDSCEEKVDVEQFYEKWKELSGKYGLSKVYFYKVRKDKSFWIWKAFELGQE